MRLHWKFYLVFVLLMLIYYFHSIWSPVVDLKVAISQTNDSLTSSTSVQSYTKIQQHLWILYIVIPALFFWKEIKNYFVEKKGDN